MFRLAAIALLLTVNVDLYTGGKYSHAAQRMFATMLIHFR